MCSCSVTVSSECGNVAPAIVKTPVIIEIVEWHHRSVVTAERVRVHALDTDVLVAHTDACSVFGEWQHA